MLIFEKFIKAHPTMKPFIKFAAPAACLSCLILASAVSAQGQNRGKDYVTPVQKAAQAADPDALGKMSGLIQLGDVVGTPQMSFDLAKASAEKGSPFGRYALGNCYENGVGVATNKQKAAELYKSCRTELERLAKNGDPLIQIFSGNCYVSRDGDDQDVRNAARWCRKAADQGNALGQVLLGSLYLEGKGVAKDPKEAIRWCRKAADQGNGKGQFLLGMCYWEGTGVVKDPKEAARWFRKAADQGNADGQFLLGMCYGDGTGVVKDPNEAARWYRKAADQGNAHGQARLGICYGEGIGVVKDPNEAARWYRKAADQGDAHGQVRLGICYFAGTGIAKDENEAARWFRKAAEQGDAEGQAGLAVACIKKGDAKECFKWSRMAADQGNAFGQYQVGQCYLIGMGTTKNTKEATIWLRKAAAQGYKGAEAELDKLASTLTRGGVNYIDPDLGKTGGPPTKDVANGIINRYGRFVGGDQPELNITIKRGKTLKVDNTTVYPIRISYLHHSGAGMITTDYYFYQDAFDTWAVTLAPGNAPPPQVR